MKRIEVYFSGNVQGVWFRGTCEKLAPDFSVTGFVENLDDGRVHLIAEGAVGECEGFLAAIKKAKAPNIDHIEVEWLDASGEYEGFVIRR